HRSFCCTSSLLLIRITPSTISIRPPPTPTLFPYTTLFRSCGRSAKMTVDTASEIGALTTTPPVKVDATFTGDEEVSFALTRRARSEEHTSELQSRFDLVCRLLLEKKKIYKEKNIRYK